MLYSDFTLESATRSLGMTTEATHLFAAVAPVAAPEWLLGMLGRRTQLALISEKARSELIVMPILLACRELTSFAVAIFSGQRFDVDADRGLAG